MTPEREIWILYASGGRKRRWRHVTPHRIWFGRIPQAPGGEQWLLDAFDHESKAPRSFALVAIQRWTTEEPSK